MNYREAQYIVEQGEPAPEEMCDIECPHCASQWASKRSSIYSLGDSHRTYYKHFVGVKYCKSTMTTAGGYQELFECPNCTSDERPVYLHYIHAAGNLSPHDEFRLAELVIEEHDLDRRLIEIRKELRNYI